MIRCILILCLFFQSSAWAQGSNPFLGGGEIRPAPVPRQELDNPLQEPASPEPILTADISEENVIPGQALRLRLTILVPTFMPSPPVWPSFEQPNILIRRPERSSSPTSRTINGASWSGITRQYQITPLVPGQFTLPVQDVRVTWSDPATGQTKQTMLTTPEVGFQSQLPVGAEEMDPFIAARDLTLTQTVEGSPDNLTLGDSLSREITVAVKGVDPMVLPVLLAVDEAPGLAAYPDAPVVSQLLDGGQRIERIVYVAESGGQGALPDVQLDWYDIDDGQIRTAQVDAIAYLSKAKALASRQPLQPLDVAKRMTGILLGVAVFWLLVFRAWPVCRRFLARRRAAYLASEPFAWSQLLRTISTRDHRHLRPALDLWSERWAGPDPRRSKDVKSALIGLGAALYGHDTTTNDPWVTLLKALKKHRKMDRNKGGRPRLPPLNPLGVPDPMS